MQHQVLLEVCCELLIFSWQHVWDYGVLGCLLAAFKQIYCIILASQSFPVLVCSWTCPNALVVSIPSLQSCSLASWGVTLLCCWSDGAAKAHSCELHGSRTPQLRAQPSSEGYIAKTADIKMSLNWTVRSLKAEIWKRWAFRHWVGKYFCKTDLATNEKLYTNSPTLDTIKELLV